ncbi:hypothetical protein PTT_16942 [Pyrenophora teres f. teres 0-1]|uniref:Rhodopsin domain-containing protein n=1 Tax=Pyrenophora teres f. teres (strain 0-1) TaxID=861557 RepID=E3S3A9_PYRTT|nr:hypothetical protein PTT_16945 [Pyrenophora teres f. teres 0-1]EFQ87540.1 hypothetical protein PTT_16942 [Pyrenophora teres f. teres 0-1]
MLLTRGPVNAGRPLAFNEEHASPLIQILTGLFLSFSISAVVAQFATKTAMSKRLIGADYVLLGALVLAIGHSAALLSPAGQFIGNTQTGLTRDTVLRAWEALYSAEILSVLSLVAAKGSLLILLDAATPFTTHRRMLYGTSAITVFWGLSAVFLITFQCPSPHRSNITNPQCINIRAVRIFIASMNVVTDLALAIVPTIMVLPLQLSPEKRLTLLIAVWSRMVVVFACAGQIYYIYALPPNSDLLNAIWRVVVAGQAIQVSSIMTSAVPFLKPFMMSLDSGLLGANRAGVTPT